MTDTDSQQGGKDDKSIGKGMTVNKEVKMIDL